ncbi:MAG: YqhA family protein [Actinobacteria bacterium]|nr:YqhA family protein [Actinomycetota bacterium]
MAGRGTRSGVQRLVGFSRYFIVIDVIGLFAAFMALMISSVWATFVVIVHAIAGDVTQKELVGKLVQQADTALLATVLYVIALGLYSLFVDDDIPMPAWLQIHHLDDLKQLLAAVVVVVLGVLFLGFALTWTGGPELLTVGLACGAVIAALSFFLWQSAHEKGHRALNAAAAAHQAAGDHGDDAAGDA